ncbi:DEKNAAC105247 [Brettanomyces naardenensis]|uniref:DEKNAAC105247 n=1 Tax=Brettanomyces naardenensis TaxID=13370 RepID=A0A448YT41_BRENA|nr:DEKNAAC105247 [Brettanomyces naardenensis]
MNVLVYSGQGTTPESVKHCLETFRLLLSPYYSVTNVSASTIIDQPWESKTSLLVIPGGADLPLCRAFNGEPNRKIDRFVRRGGKFIGLCSGGYYASHRCEFEVGDPSMEVSGTRELGFFPGTCRGCAYKGFSYGSDIGAKAVEVSVNQQSLPGFKDSTVFNYYNGGGLFVNAQSYSNTEVLASYSEQADVLDSPEGNQAAVVLCSVGRGKALLAGTHPEFTPDLLQESAEVPGFSEVIKTLRNHNGQRLAFLRACLKKLGLQVNESDTSRPSLTPLYLTGMNPPETSALIDTMEKNMGYEIQNVVNGGNDKFSLHRSLKDLALFHQKQGYEDPELAIKEIFACAEGYPDRRLTPYFNFDYFHDELNKAYQNLGIHGEFGRLLMYGEVVTSTSILMDSNIRLLQCLPNGFTIHGTVQVCGKGRSGNYWVNPPGVLAVSTLHKLPLPSAQRSPIVFLQYLSAMAFTKAIWEYGEGYSEVPLRIKWPNDIYILLPDYIGKNLPKNSTEATHAKVGGIIVNANVIDDNYYLVVGSGLNVSNAAPTTSINMVIDAMNKYWQEKGINKHLDRIKIEKLLAKYLSIFNSMFNVFRDQGFRPFIDSYYQMWFHSNQIVHILSEGNARAQIVGITPDWGLLLAREIDSNDKPTGTMYELQPDGNSFDMFRGLISKKQ